MLRPSRPALLPHHRFRAGTAQTLQAAQGRARGRGQAGFWSCAPKPEVTAEDVQKLEARIAQIENGQVSGQIQNEEFTGLEARIAQIEGVTKDVKTLQANETWTKKEILKIHNFLNDKFDTSSMHRESDHGNIGGHSRDVDNNTAPPVWIMPDGEDGASNADATVDENPGDGNTDATGDGKLHTISAKKYSLRCSRAGPTSKPRHSGYGDLRV